MTWIVLLTIAVAAICVTPPNVLPAIASTSFADMAFGNPRSERIPSHPMPQSPDGQRIAFVSVRDRNFEIYVMNSDGTGQVNLTNHPDNDTFPAWSPDGQQITFDSSRDGNSEIYIMNADGTGQTRLTNHPADDLFPSWSPDGQRIAFSSDRDGNLEIYIINTDGTGLIRLTDNPYSDVEASWSPDGQQIAFSSGSDSGSEIYVIAPDGTGRTNLTNHPGGVGHPSWSPGGQRIAFQSYRDGNLEIYVMNADGTGQVNLTNHPASDEWPSWSPDGQRIAFFSERNGNAKIYSMNADGTDPTNLTEGSFHDIWPSWSPADPDRVETNLIQMPTITEGPIAGMPGPEATTYDWVSGTGPVGAQIYVYQNLEGALPIIGQPYGENLGVASVEENCDWVLQGISLLPGENVFTAVAELDGVYSEPSEPYHVVRPEAPVITYPPSENGRASIEFIGDVVGTSQASAAVHLYQRTAGDQKDTSHPYGDEIKEVTAGSNGNWYVRGVELQPGKNVFVAFAELAGQFSEPSEALYVVMPAASTYGASYWYYLGGEYVELSGTSVEVGIETLDTREEAETTARLLGIHGYDSQARLDASASVALSYLPYDQVFYFTGHGSNRCISFEDASDVGSSLCSSSLDGAVDLSGLQLAVLNACKTGKDPTAPDSILAAFHRQGTETVIGFNHKLEAEVARDWNTLFWNYTLEEGFSVGDAAYQAAEDVSARMWWWPFWGIDPEAIVLLGNYDLELNTSR